MSIYELSKENDVHLNRRAVVCVVGAGIAGLLAAIRLARTGRRVIVIESGGNAFNEQIHELNTIEDPSGRYVEALTGRFRGFGGTSSHWGGRLMPLTVHDTGPRPYLSLPGWPVSPRELGTYTPEIERLFGVTETSYEEDLIEKLDPERLLPRNDPDIAVRWFKSVPFHRANVGAILRREVSLLKDLEVWLGATVCGFKLDRSLGRLAAITASGLDGRVLTVSADEFVFAAGTIETTRLLLLMDVFSEKHAFAKCDALGHYFQEHARAGVGQVRSLDLGQTNRLFGYRLMGSTRRNIYFELKPERQEADAVASGYAEVALDLPHHSSLTVVRDMLRRLQKGQLEISAKEVGSLAAELPYLSKATFWRIFRRQLLFSPDTRLKLEVSIEQVPNWSNRITLSQERDRFGVPRARLEWKLAEPDEHTFRSVMRRTAEYWRRCRFDNVCPIVWEKWASDGSTKIIDFAELRAHPSGSTRMGVDPRTSVVGADLRCHHVPNISIASASTFPSSGSINPTLTIMQLALRAADAVIRRTSSAVFRHHIIEDDFTALQTR